MNKSAAQVLREVDLVLFVVDRTRWTDEDEMVWNKVRHLECPVLLVVNKVDRLEDKKDMLPHLEWLAAQLPQAEIVPVSALHGGNIERLEQLVAERLPESEHYYPEDQLTDRSSRFLSSALVCEKVMSQLGAEVPYQVAAEIEQLGNVGKLLPIHAS